jgi:hypothetical protein
MMLSCAGLSSSFLPSSISECLPPVDTGVPPAAPVTTAAKCVAESQSVQQTVLVIEELADAAQTLVICPAESPCVCTHATITADDETADFRLESADAAASPLAEDTVESADAASVSATTDFEPETTAHELLPPSCSDAGNEMLAASHVSTELRPEPDSNIGQRSELEPEDLICDIKGALAEARHEDQEGCDQQTNEDLKSCPFVMNPLENDHKDKQDTEDPQEQEVGHIEDATDQQEAKEEVVEQSEEAVAEEALEAVAEESLEAESTEDAAAYLRVRSCDEYTSVLSPIVEDVDGSRPEASEDDLMEVAGGSLSEAGTPSPREENGNKLEDPSRPHSRAEECSGGGGGGGIHLALMAPPAGFADSPERLRRESSLEERQLPQQQQQLELDLEMSVEVVGETEAGEGDLVEDALPLQMVEVKNIWLHCAKYWQSTP